MKIKNIIPILILGIISINVSFGQTIKVYNHYTFSNAFSKKSSSYSFTLGQILEHKKIVSFRFLASTSFTSNVVKSGPLESFRIKSNKIEITKNSGRSNITIPLGFEVEYKGFGGGISQEILSLGFRNNLSVGRFENLPANGTDSTMFIKPNNFSSIFSSKEKNNLNSKLYIYYTISDSFSILFGLNRQKVIYNFKNAEGVILDRAGVKAVQPFVSLRFNVEK